MPVVKSYTCYPSYVRKCWVCDAPLSRVASGSKNSRRKPVHTKTCSPRCRKALSRMMVKEDALGVNVSHFQIGKCDTAPPSGTDNREFVRVK